jgi:hypothetical protein
MMNSLSVLEKVEQVLNEHCESPIQEMRAMGNALVQIADALEGKSVAECRAIIRAVQELSATRQA